MTNLKNGRRIVRRRDVGLDFVLSAAQALLRELADDHDTAARKGDRLTLAGVAGAAAEATAGMTRCLRLLERDQERRFHRENPKVGPAAGGCCNGRP